MTMNGHAHNILRLVSPTLHLDQVGHVLLVQDPYRHNTTIRTKHGILITGNQTTIRTRIKVTSLSIMEIPLRKDLSVLYLREKSLVAMRDQIMGARDTMDVMIG